MTKNYLYIALLLVFFFSMSLSAQEVKKATKIQDPQEIEGLSVYPNPATNGRVFINTKSEESKDVQIFDVIGKKMLHVQVSSREINISSLSPGVYIIKITELNATSTRKLIVR